MANILYHFPGNYKPDGDCLPHLRPDKRSVCCEFWQKLIEYGQQNIQGWQNGHTQDRAIDSREA